MTESTTLVEQFREHTEAAWNRGEVDSVDDLFAPDVVVHDAQSGETYDGRDAFKEWISAVRTAFPDFAVDMAETMFLVDEDHVVSQWVVRGTHEGPLAGVEMEPTHEAIELHGATVYELRDGQVIEAWWHYDNLALLGQLGAIPEGLTA